MLPHGEAGCCPPGVCFLQTVLTCDKQHGNQDVSEQFVFQPAHTSFTSFEPHNVPGSCLEAVLEVRTLEPDNLGSSLPPPLSVWA